MSPKATIDIVITSFNGRKLLEKQLPVVIQNSPNINQIIVVDDHSADDTASFLSSRYPKIKLIQNSKNLGFTRSTNVGVNSSQADFVVLLNNDVYPQKNYLSSALKHFSDPHLFAVTFNETHSSWPEVSWRGKLNFIQGNDKSSPHLSAWASGGSSLIKRTTWASLNGFNPLFSPGYWEDIDLGYRAWKQGLSIIWEPKAQVIHRHESTFKTLNPNFVTLIKQRNELLFTWMNITDRHLAFDHYRYLLNYTLHHLGFFKVILAAFRYYPQVLLSRRRNRKLALRSDKEVLALINKPLTEK